MIGTNRYIGSPVERIEDERFLRGRGQFVGDLTRESMLHAAVLRSPIAHGRLTAVDATAALAIRGVRAVITAKDIGPVPRIPLRLLPLPGTERFLQPVIAADRVDRGAFEGFRTIVLERGEELAAGVLPIGDKHVIADIRYRTALKTMRRAGVTVEAIDLYEFGKIGLTPSMLALALKRS